MTIGKILLVTQILIAGNECFKSAFFRAPDQLTIFQATPTHFLGRVNLIAG